VAGFEIKMMGLMFRRAPGIEAVAFAGCGVFSALSLGCGESNAPNGEGGAPSAMPGGAGGGSMAGSAGGIAEGGSAGSAPADAGIDASGGVSGSGGSATPPGCPEPNPAPANDAQKVVIQSVHFGRSEIVLQNISDTDQTLVGGRLGWQWCNAPDYWNVVIGEADVVLGPGDTYAFRLLREDGRLRPLYPGDDPFDANELGIYTTTGAFMTSDLMAAFVSWGEGSSGNSRENVASMANLWVFGQRVEIQPGHAGFIATGPADRGDGYTSVPGRCLPANP
jgi:hypothetical protein